MSAERLDERAELIALNPKLRAEYFDHPGKVLARAIPRQGLSERISLGMPERARGLRAELGKKVESIISNDPRLVTAREAYFGKNLFLDRILDQAVRNALRTFDAIIRLSAVAFVAGVSLLVGAFVAAVFGDDTTEKAVLGGLSGAGGAAATLGTVFTFSRQAIRKAIGDNAQILLIITGFATEVTNLRSIPMSTFEEVKARNEQIRGAMSEAVQKIEQYVEPK